MVLLKYKAQNAPDQPIMSEAYYYRLVLTENNQKDAYDLIFRGELLKSNHDILHPMLKYQVRWLDGFRYFEENIYEILHTGGYRNYTFVLEGKTEQARLKLFGEAGDD